MKLHRSAIVSLGENGFGEIVVLSNGTSGTIGSLFKIARSLGFDGCHGSFAKRIKAGCRDMKELCRPVDADKSRKARGARKRRKEDPEFLAALAAVSARRGGR